MDPNPNPNPDPDQEETYKRNLTQRLHLYLDRTPLVEYDNEKRDKQDEKKRTQERLSQVNKMRRIIGELVGDWEDYVTRHNYYLTLPISADYFKPYENKGLDGLNINNIRDYELLIKGIPQKLVTTDIKTKDWDLITRKAKNASRYIQLKKKYEVPICDLLTTDPKAITECLIRIAMDMWLDFVKTNSNDVPLSEIKEILRKPNVTPTELATSSREQIIHKIELGVSDSLPLSAGGRQYKRPRKSSATKRRPRRKSSAIKRRRRRTSRK